MSDLRTRIATIIHRECGYEGENFCQHLAGVLVAELDLDEIELQREFSIGDDDGGRVLWYEGEEPVTPRDGEVVECRWISKWERDA